MKKLTDRIRHHNSWRRGEHSDTYDVTKIGLDLDLIVNEHDKLTAQNKMLREALQLVSDIIPIYQNANGGGYMLILSDDDCRIIKESLNISDL